VNHLIHAALLNPDVTVLVHNNFLFGMTGGQSSALTPPEFVTSTTPEGNSVPPLDLAQVMLASRASFVARKVTGDRDLSQVIARAIAHPGFALVEVLELCTAYGTRWNPLTGARLREVAADVGYELGIIKESVRPTFGSTYRERAARSRSNPSEPGVAPGRFSGSLARPLGVVLAGTAGEHVQTAARLLCQAALWSGLEVTQKYDSPVTQGTGFSVAEVILSAEPILYTGIHAPDGVLVVSEDGARELQASGVLARVTPETLVFADEQTPLPQLSCRVVRLPFRSKAGASDAALAAVAVWLEKTRAVPLESLWAAVDARFGYDADTVAGKLQQMLEIAYPRK
jgi:hypothetical protein